MLIEVHHFQGIEGNQGPPGLPGSRGPPVRLFEKCDCLRYLCAHLFACLPTCLLIHTFNSVFHYDLIFVFVILYMFHELNSSFDRTKEKSLKQVT